VELLLVSSRAETTAPDVPTTPKLGSMLIVDRYRWLSMAGIVEGTAKINHENEKRDH